MEKHLFLVGYRGCGKSSVGRQLGSVLGLPVIDSDDYVESDAGKSIREVFDAGGELSFRDLETKAIQDIVVRSESTIVSLGGGAILRESNRTIIKENGATVWLQASAGTIASRIAQDLSTAERRPALTQLTGYEEIVKLLEIREPLYRLVADSIVVADDRGVDEIAQEIAHWYAHFRQSETETSNR